MTVFQNKIQKKPIFALLLCLIFMSLFLSLSVALAFANDHIIFVDASATSGADNGNSWGNAYTDLQSALDEAEAGDEIWVANGVYKPSARTNPSEARSVTFELIEGVKMYGGFAGGESDLDDRDWEANLTILSGDIDNNDTDVNSNNGITTHYDSVNGSNAYNIIIGSNTISYTNATVVDGFTITGGQTQGGGGEAGISDGAGLRFGNDASPVLRNLHVIGHKGSDDGGAIYFQHENNPVFENVTIENTSANDFGGGIFFFSDNNPTFKNLTILNTVGRYSSGIYMHENNTAEFVNFYACGNVSTNSNANANGNAGTALSFASNNIIQVSNAAFAANVAGENGGAIRMRENNDVTLTNVTMAGNQATNGGGIHVREAGNTITIANSILWGNSSEIHEGASATINTTYSIIGDGAAPSGTGNVASGSSPFTTDPTDGADNIWGTDDDTCGDLQLDALSSAIDVGSNGAIQLDRLDIDDDGNTAEQIQLDLVNRARTFITTVDMGAYEFSTARDDQTITFTSPANNSSKFVGETATLSATASSGLSVSFESLTPSICSISSSTLTFNGVGTCTVQASQAGDGDYNPAPSISHSISVSKQDQTITFTSPADMSTVIVEDDIDLIVSTTSGLDIALASTTPSVCSVEDKTATMLVEGTCTIEASQAGNDAYNPAETVTLTLTVSKADQGIDFAVPANGGTAYLNQDITINATATSGLAVTVVSNSPAVCTISDGVATMIALGSCSLTVSQAGNSVYNAAASVTNVFTVAEKQDQTIEVTNPTHLSGAALNDTISLVATASSGLPVTFTSFTPAVCTVSGNTAETLAYGTCNLVASQAGNAGFNPAPNIVLTVFVKQQQAVDFPNSPSFADAEVGDELTLAASADSELPITYNSLTPSVCTVTGSTAKIIKHGTCTIEAVQSGNDDWFAADAQISFVIEQTGFFVFLPTIRR